MSDTFVLGIGTTVNFGTHLDLATQMTMMFATMAISVGTAVMLHGL